MAAAGGGEAATGGGVKKWLDALGVLGVVGIDDMEDTDRRSSLEGSRPSTRMGMMRSRGVPQGVPQGVPEEGDTPPTGKLISVLWMVFPSAFSFVFSVDSQDLMAAVESVSDSGDAVIDGVEAAIG